MKHMNGKNALITGGAGGLGLTIACALAGEGVNIALSDNLEFKFESALKTLSAFSVQKKCYPYDITVPAERIKLVDNCLFFVSPKNKSNNKVANTTPICIFKIPLGPNVLYKL